MVPATNDSAPVTKILDPFRFEQDQDELLRYLGYNGPKATGRSLPIEIERIVQRGQEYLRPKAIYSIYRVLDSTPRELTIGGVAIRGKVTSFLANADQIAVFVVTVGNEITERARAASNGGNLVAAWALDALGSYAAEATAAALSRYLEQLMGAPGTVSPRYSPGYCSMCLAEQLKLFSLIDAERIGVTLEESMWMQPIKSVSGLLGISADGALGALASPCARCDMLNCSMRR